MATHYLHEYVADTTANALVKFNSATPDKPNTFGIGVVSGVIYPGNNNASPPALINFGFNTQNLSKTIRLNSQTDSVTTSGDLIGFQSFPRSGIAGSQNVIGCQISSQISTGIATTGSIIGAHSDVFLRGTAAGTIGGDVRGLQVELVTDDAGTRDITGNVSGIRIRMAFSAGTVSGIRSAIRIEKPEVQTGSETYDCAFELTGAIPLVWNSAPGTEPSTADGYIKVRVNGADRFIQLYSTAPTD